MKAGFVLWRAAGLFGLAALIALAVPSRADAGRVSGTVVDREGKPAAGAKVWAGKVSYLEPLETKEGTADESGAFSIEVGPGRWAVFALRGKEGGRAGWDSIAMVEDGKEPAPVTIRLRPPTTLKGRLLDAETGEPIAHGYFTTNDARRLEVDADGRFEAPGLESTNHEAYPLCPGYERKRILFDTTGRPDAELELKIPKAGKVVGRVLDAEGKPIPGATVGLATSGSIFSGATLWERCTEDGRFSYDGRPLGRAGRLMARATGYQDLERSDVVTLDPAKPMEMDFTLIPDPTKGQAAKPVDKPANRRTVTGMVTGPDGKPVASALVRWDLRYGSNYMQETKTDDRGAFRLEGAPDEANVLSVMAKGLAPAFPPIEAGGDREVTVELKAGTTIRGRVVDDAGSPVEGARVAPQIANPKPRMLNRVYLDELTAKTDRDGRFALEGMPDGVTCDVVSQGHSSVRQRPLSATDEAKNVIELAGEGAIRGRVVGLAGEPVRNFRVQVGIPKGAKPGEPVGGYFAGYSGTGLAFTRDDGEFTISGLTARNLHLLTVIAEGFGAGVVDRVEAQSIGRLKPADALTIKLGEPHALRVRVYQAGGKVVEGGRVTVIQNEGQGGGFQWGVSDSSWDDSVTAVVDDRGWATFPAIGFGKGTIVVRARGFAREKLDWANGEGEFNVFLEPEAKIAGTVLDVEGKPIPGATLMLSWGTGEMMIVPVAEKDGRFAVDGLAAGEYGLNVMQENGAGGPPMSAVLEAGKTQTVDLRIKRPAPGAARGR